LSEQSYFNIACMNIKRVEIWCKVTREFSPAKRIICQHNLLSMTVKGLRYFKENSQCLFLLIKLSFIKFNTLLSEDFIRWVSWLYNFFISLIYIYKSYPFALPQRISIRLYFINIFCKSCEPHPSTPYVKGYKKKI